jgi:hypothetical protein
MRRKQNVHRRGAAILDPEAFVLFQGDVGADQNRQGRRGHHPGMGLNVRQLRQNGAIADADEMPGLGVAGAGRGHRGAQDGIDLGIADRLAGEPADAAAGHQIGNGVHRGLPFLLPSRERSLTPIGDPVTPPDAPAAG